MQFLWSNLLGLLVFPLSLLAIYVWIQRRRARFPLRYSSLLVVKQAYSKRSGLRRHVPPLLFLFGLTAMLLALARPFTEILIPKEAATIILTIDTSASMGARDIKPTRLQAAKAAARAFVEHQDPMPRVGIVAFSDSAYLVQSPTIDRAAVIAAIDRLDLDTTTAIGRGILTSLDAVLQENNMALLAAAPPLTPAPGSGPRRAPAAIVLLTDGQNVVGPTPLEAAQKAAQYGVRVFTIGIGTNKGMAGVAPRGGAAFNDDLDEETLQKIATMTDAKYFRADDEAVLTAIYTNLDTQVVMVKEKAELTIGFTAAAILLNTIGGMLSILWFNRLP